MKQSELGVVVILAMILGIGLGIIISALLSSPPALSGVWVA